MDPRKKALQRLMDEDEPAAGGKKPFGQNPDELEETGDEPRAPAEPSAPNPTIRPAHITKATIGPVVEVDRMSDLSPREAFDLVDRTPKSAAEPEPAAESKYSMEIGEPYGLSRLNTEQSGMAGLMAKLGLGDEPEDRDEKYARLVKLMDELGIDPADIKR